MGKLADLFVEIGGHSQALDKDLSTTLAKIQGMAGQAQGLMNVAISATVYGKIGKTFMELADAGAALGGSIRRSGVIFGDNSRQIVGFADQMAEKFGTVRSESISATTAMGTFLRGGGMDEAKAAKMAIELTKLADGAASFYRIPLGDAVQKVGMGLMGATRGLHEWGIFITDDQIKAEALRMKIRDTTGELTEQEQMTVRMSLITKELTKYTDAHTASLSGYQGQIKMLKGELENWKEDVGVPFAKSLGMVMKQAREGGIGSAFAKSWQSITNEFKYEFSEAWKFWSRPSIWGAGGISTPFIPSPRPENPWTIRDKGLPAFKPGELPPTREQEFQKAVANIDAFIFKAKKMAPDTAMGPTGPFGMFGTLILDNMLKQMLEPGRKELLYKPYEKLTEEEKQHEKMSLDFQIMKKRKESEAWTGGHIMDTESFLKAAQEKLLTPTDETAKRQLDEMTKSREFLEKIERKMQPGKEGTVVRGKVQ